MRVSPQRDLFIALFTEELLSTFILKRCACLIPCFWVVVGAAIREWPEALAETLDDRSDEGGVGMICK